MILGGTAQLVCGIDPADGSVYPLPIDSTNGLLVSTSGLRAVKSLGGTTIVGCTIEASTGRVYAIPVTASGIDIGGNAVEVKPSDQFVVLCGVGSNGKIYALPKSLSGSLQEVWYLGGAFKLACGVASNGSVYTLPVSSTDWRGSNPTGIKYLGDTAVVLVGIDPVTQGQVALQMDSSSGVVVQVTGPGAGFWPDRYYAPRYWANRYYK